MTALYIISIAFMSLHLLMRILALPTGKVAEDRVALWFGIALSALVIVTLALSLAGAR